VVRFPEHQNLNLNKKGKKMNDGDLIIKYKLPYSIDNELDKKINEFFETLGYKWKGSGFSINDNTRDISFIKEIK